MHSCSEKGEARLIQYIKRVPTPFCVRQACRQRARNKEQQAEAEASRQATAAHEGRGISGQLCAEKEMDEEWEEGAECDDAQDIIEQFIEYKYRKASL